MTDAKPPRLTLETLRALRVIANSRDGVAGSQIAKIAKLSSGTLYPILFRLERAGWLTSRWETELPQALGRPRRRIYSITGKGVANMRPVTDELASLERLQWT
ncbi:MAG TPA: helix-turn-helix transcriptional regulator [Caulobacteraceae bacterium]|jgi:DNA-binding PadR family transcriptional regulator